MSQTETRTRPTRSQPRIVTYYIRRDGGEFEPTGEFGCSDEWLAANPGWARDPDGPDVMGRLAAPLSRSDYPEGEAVAVRAVVDDLRDGVIAERTWTIAGAGEPISSTEAADIAGVQPSTWRSYVARGQAPKPDYPAEAHGAISAKFGGPWWKRSTVEEWKTTRPGQGARTDRG